MECRLASEKATAILAGYLARLIGGGTRVMLFTGPLGSGKTSCIRDIVRELPGSEKAEIASPSFSVCNRYPVTPSVLHCDLYRTGTSIPEEILEALDEPDTAVLVEWAEFLPESLRPASYLSLSLAMEGSGRILSITAEGEARDALLCLERELAADHPELFATLSGPGEHRDEMTGDAGSGSDG